MKQTVDETVAVIGVEMVVEMIETSRDDLCGKMN
jgi:hypothetical protein